jgi:hypothetical protein
VSPQKTVNFHPTGWNIQDFRLKATKFYPAADLWLPMMGRILTIKRILATKRCEQEKDSRKKAQKTQKLDHSRERLCSEELDSCFRRNDM